MKNQVFIAAILVLALASGVLFYRTQELQNNWDAVENAVQDVNISSSAAQEEIRQLTQNTAVAVQDAWKIDLQNQAEMVLSEALFAFQIQLDSIVEEIEVQKQELAELESRKTRAEQGLPELVSLDDLGEYYRGKLADSTPFNMNVETFQTSMGEIGFRKPDFSFVRVPSTDELASLRIGQRNSTTNSELIQAWLEESASSKTQQGYQLIYDKTEPNDYGEYTEKLYKNGDMYFKTYFQYERVLETYDRHSLQYTFYLETGSESRLEQQKLEEYNNKLGS